MSEWLARPVCCKAIPGSNPGPISQLQDHTAVSRASTTHVDDQSHSDMFLIHYLLIFPKELIMYIVQILEEEVLHESFFVINLIVPDMRVWGLLACPEINQKHKKRSRELYIQYDCCTSYCISVVYAILRTHDVYLYKSVKSSSIKGRDVHVKYESMEQTTSYQVGQDKQAGYKITGSKGRAQSNLRTRPGWTYSQGAARNSLSNMYECI